MKSWNLLLVFFLVGAANLYAITDSLPLALSANHSDLVYGRFRQEAAMRFAVNRLPGNVKDWDKYRAELRKEIIKKTGAIINHELPIDIKKLSELKMPGYLIQNIIFQGRPGGYATANLFIPDGKGPFPAVINLHAHSGRFDDDDQGVGHSLALNGYVCLSVDPWGAGERTTIHGKEEYHGASLGASFFNIGESLMGAQISDNIRGVDLLCSLPYVDAKNIGAAGASGGGNQTMWLAAADGRIKAADPVVSVGTFEAYVMRDNCICETLIDGLTFTEEAGVLALVSPGAIQLCNHLKDEGPSFFPSEMLRSYHNALPVFKMMGVEKNIDYKIFDLPHGYLAQDRQAMLGWFDLHLKGIGNGEPKAEIPYKILHDGELMVFPKGKRDSSVYTTASYCKKIGSELRSEMLHATAIDQPKKKKELNKILRSESSEAIKEIHYYTSESGWERMAIETAGGKLIPLLIQLPKQASLGYTLLINPKGKKSIPAEIIESHQKKGSGIVLLDLSGTGEAASATADKMDDNTPFHTMSRASLWLGQTSMGEWVKELRLTLSFLATKYGAKKVVIDGSGETGLA
ncbi:MAG: acetylxylan esterase, partial [Flavitalea sp.]